jgi:hypothetical protein
MKIRSADPSVGTSTLPRVDVSRQDSACALAETAHKGTNLAMPGATAVLQRTRENSRGASGGTARLGSGAFVERRLSLTHVSAAVASAPHRSGGRSQGSQVAKIS